MRLYWHACRRRGALGLTPLEVFDVKIALGSHLVSVSVGTLSVAVAMLAPTGHPELAGPTYFLMGPAQFGYHSAMARRRRALIGLST